SHRSFTWVRTHPYRRVRATLAREVCPRRGAEGHGEGRGRVVISASAPGGPRPRIATVRRRPRVVGTQRRAAPAPSDWTLPTMARILVRSAQDPRKVLPPEKSARAMGGNSGNLLYANGVQRALSLPENVVTSGGFGAH